MELYIQIRDGIPYEHPILGENFRENFPNLDVNNLPPEFAKFERIPKPNLGPYYIFENLSYEWVGDVVKDVWHFREMTNEEKLSKQEFVKNAWVNIGRPSWIFNETTCDFDPPVPYPDDGKAYGWDESTISWIEIT